MPKPKIKKLVFLIILLVSFYLLSQIIIYAFFAESKIVKIKTAEMNEKTYDEIKERVYSKNTVKKEWRGNDLIITHFMYLPCNQVSYIRYNKDTIEILIMEPIVQCWGEATAKKSYTIRYNNIILSFKDYLSNKDLLTYEVCEIHKHKCIVDGNIITEYEQAKDYGFIELKDYDDLDLKNLDYSLSDKDLKNTEIIIEQQKRQDERNGDLQNIMLGLKEYYNKNNSSYPVSEQISKISDRNSDIYNTLKEFVNEEYLTDPEYPVFYYGYRSINGNSYEIFMKSENPDSKCRKEQGLCIISSEDVKYTYPSNK